MGTAEQDFAFRSIALPAIAPTLMFSLGEGAIIPIIPVVANSLGASLAVAGLIASMIMLGELFGDIPSGWIVSRIGERTAMIYAALLSIVGLVTALLAPNPWVLGVGILAVGLSTAVFALARHAFMTSFSPSRWTAGARLAASASAGSCSTMSNTAAAAQPTMCTQKTDCVLPVKWMTAALMNGPTK
jgi:MFS family permease